MTVSMTFFDSFTRDCQNGAFPADLRTATLYGMICDSTYTPNYSTHTKRSDLTAEVSGTGYTAGGQALTALAEALDTVNHLTNFQAANLTWNPVTFTNGRYLAIYQHRGGAASADELVCLIDFGANQSPAAQSFSVQWNASGVWALSRA